MVQKGQYTFEGDEWDEISAEAKDLIKRLITKPEKRLTAEEALEHKWFKKWSKLNKEPQYLKKRNLKAFKQYMKSYKIA